jgi:hypothetical protein
VVFLFVLNSEKAQVLKGKIQGINKFREDEEMKPKASEDWRLELPNIKEIKPPDSQLQILGRFQNAAKSSFFYVAQAKREKDYWSFWGYIVKGGNKYPIGATISSHDLENGTWLGGGKCKVDEAFVPKKWSEIRAAHFPPPRDLFEGRANSRRRVKTHPDVLPSEMG